MVLRLRVSAPGSWKNAKCLGKVYKDEQGEVHDPWFDEEEQNEAIDFCNGTSDGVVCPIREECLVFALTNNEKMGIWGGMSERDRRALRKVYPWRARQGANPNWTWMSPGEAVALLKPSQRKELEEDDDEETG